MHSTFEISKATIRFNDLHDPSGAEAKFIEREIDLAAVRRVRVDEGWLARRGRLRRPARPQAAARPAGRPEPRS